MNCVIEGNCVKVFGKAIHALSRVGDELWLDPTVKGETWVLLERLFAFMFTMDGRDELLDLLPAFTPHGNHLCHLLINERMDKSPFCAIIDAHLALRSVNSAHSAYGCFLFSPLFFQQYKLVSISQHGSGGAIKCKLLMKSVLPLFRCLPSIERNVERCHISISLATDRVIIQFFCRHGIIKTHNIHFQESEALQAVFASHLCPNVLRAPAKLLADMVMHFPLFQEEITLSISPMKISLRNYQEGGKSPMKTTYTDMSLHSDEFDYVQIGLQSDITFCLKELRGILSFAEFQRLPVSVYLDAPGKPVCFSLEDMVLEATVLLATLVDSESRDGSQPTEPLTPTTPRSAQPADAFQEPKSMGHNIPDELVASSQGSPIFSSPKQTHLYPQMIGPACLSVPSAATSPASPKICSLLFQALSSEQCDGGCAAKLPVLACYSDEENTDDNHLRSPSL